MNAFLRRLLCGLPGLPHAWTLKRMVCMGATIGWSLCIVRSWDHHEACSICGKTRVDPGYVGPSREFDDKFGPRDGWDDDLWPLDKHGQRLPTDSDVRGGRKPVPEVSVGLECGARFRPLADCHQAERRTA